MISACLCTHAPRLQTLRHCLEALRHQVPPPQGLELVVIDNASPEPLTAARIGLNDFPYPSRLVREERLGLTHARLRALREARGEILILVDDDNVLAPGYAGAVADLFHSQPHAGVAGGISAARFESAPPPWFDLVAGHLAIRDLGEQPRCLSRTGEEPPVGAGLAVLATAFQQAVQVPLLLQDRRGRHLTSGGDTELCVRINLLGWESWYHPALRMEHIIPSARLSWEYLTRLSEGFGMASPYIELYSGFRPRWRMLWYLRRARYHRQLARRARRPLLAETRGPELVDRGAALQRLESAYHRGKARGLCRLAFDRSSHSRVEPFLRSGERQGENSPAAAA
jgi:glycosyltransferase involved in cell wall biosynthesis